MTRAPRLRPAAAVAVAVMLAAAACTEARAARSPATPPGGVRRATAPPTAPEPSWPPQPPAQILSRGAVLSGVGVPEPGGVLAIGDSILFSAADALTAAFGGEVEIDAEIGREFVSAEGIVADHRAEGPLPGTVIVELGTNASLTDDEFDALMGALSGVRRVFFVTVSVPRPYEDATNEILAAGVERWNRAHLIDWHEVAAGHPDYFRTDGYHLSGTGVEVFADVVRASV
jgi:hypothetical protein